VAAFLGRELLFGAACGSLDDDARSAAADAAGLPIFDVQSNGSDRRGRGGCRAIQRNAAGLIRSAPAADDLGKIEEAGSSFGGEILGDRAVPVLRLRLQRGIVTEQREQAEDGKPHQVVWLSAHAPS